MTKSLPGRSSRGVAGVQQLLLFGVPPSIAGVSSARPLPPLRTGRLTQRSASAARRRKLHLEPCEVHRGRRHSSCSWLEEALSPGAGVPALPRLNRALVVLGRRRGLERRRLRAAALDELLSSLTVVPALGSWSPRGPLPPLRGEPFCLRCRCDATGWAPSLHAGSVAMGVPPAVYVRGSVGLYETDEALGRRILDGHVPSGVGAARAGWSRLLAVPGLGAPAVAFVQDVLGALDNADDRSG